MSAEFAELSEFLDSLAGLEGISSDDIESLRRMAGGVEPVDLPASLISEVEPVLEVAPEEVKPAAAPSEDSLQSGQAAPAEDESLDLRVRLQNMNIPQKLKLSLFGNATCRGILIMDSSRIVQASVLRSPKIQPGEVEAFSKNHNVSDLVLREIARSRNWMKSYTVKMNLVTNPKTPSDIALRWLHFLVKADLRKISMSKNLPQIVAINARKILADMDKKRQ